MTNALVGLLGVFFGLLINEYFRRNNRIEKYSSYVFEKRLNIYENLLILVKKSSSNISEAIENNQLKKEKVHVICHKEILNVCEYCEENELYLNEDLTVEICTRFLVIHDDIIEIENNKERAAQLKKFRISISNIKQMIKSDSGVDELNNLFSKITKTKHSTPYIEHYRELKRKSSLYHR